MYPHKKNLRIQKSPDTCGRSLNPLNLVKIVCIAKWVKEAKCVSSDFLNEKVLMILTCIILKIKGSIKINSKLEALGGTLLSAAIG